MIKYVLASSKAREKVNLKDYADEIADAVLDIIDEDETVVHVCADNFYLDTDALVRKCHLICINDRLINSGVGQYSTKDGEVFTAIEEDDGQNDVN